MGSSRSSAGVSGARAASAPKPGTESNFCKAAMARSGSPICAATRARISIGWGPSFCLTPRLVQPHGDCLPNLRLDRNRPPNLRLHWNGTPDFPRPTDSNLTSAAQRIKGVSADKTGEGCNCEGRKNHDRQSHPAIAFGTRVLAAAIASGSFFGLRAKALDGLNNLIDVGIDFDLPLLLLRIIWRVHDFFLSVASRTRGQTKTADHQGAAVCHFSGGDFCSANYLAAHRRELCSRSRHRGSPLLGCQTRFGVIRDVAKMVSSLHPEAIKIRRQQPAGGRIRLACNGPAALKPSP